MPSTALRDRHTKFQLYEQQGVKYYLIADADKKTVEVFVLKNTKYEVENTVSYAFALKNTCLITPDLTNIFK